MNTECLKAINAYYDPDSTAYKKAIHMQWIEANFSEKDIKECKKKVKWSKEIVAGYAQNTSIQKPLPTTQDTRPGKHNFKPINRYTNSYKSNHERLIDKLRVY